MHPWFKKVNPYAQGRESYATTLFFIWSERGGSPFEFESSVSQMTEPPRRSISSPDNLLHTSASEGDVFELANLLSSLSEREKEASIFAALVVELAFVAIDFSQPNVMHFLITSYAKRLSEEQMRAIFESAVLSGELESVRCLFECDKGLIDEIDVGLCLRTVEAQAYEGVAVWLRGFIDLQSSDDDQIDLMPESKKTVSSISKAGSGQTNRPSPKTVQEHPALDEMLELSIFNPRKQSSFKAKPVVLLGDEPAAIRLQRSFSV